MGDQQQISVERAARIRIGRPGAILERDRDAEPAVVEDISTTGCFVRGDFSIAVGSLLAVGVPGIGTHAARVMRLTADGAGCAFLMPLSAAEVDAVRTAEAAEPMAGDASGRGGGFVQVRDNIRSAAKARQEQRGAAAPASLIGRIARALKPR